MTRWYYQAKGFTKRAATLYVDLETGASEEDALRKIREIHPDWQISELKKESRKQQKQR